MLTPTRSGSMSRYMIMKEPSFKRCSSGEPEPRKLPFHGSLQVSPSSSDREKWTTLSSYFHCALYTRGSQRVYDRKRLSSSLMIRCSVALA